MLNAITIFVFLQYFVAASVLETECESSDDCFPELVCREQQCVDCISTEECQNRSELTKCEAGQCVHKDVRPFVALDGVALLCMFVAGSVAAGGGLGGGGIFVPMLILILAFSARDAA